MDICAAITIVESSFGSFSADEAKEIGDCAIIAIANITGKTWDEVFTVAQPYFGRYGMNAGGISRTFTELGWSMSYYMPVDDMTVRAAEAYLRVNDPDIRLCCQINVGRIPHSISFVNGSFDNVQGAYRAKVRSAYKVTPTGGE
jgi:hypothetical protein